MLLHKDKELCRSNGVHPLIAKEKAAEYSGFFYGATG
jgi:hypothetical protein